MTYITGTMTDANPGPALYSAMEPTLLAVGYTLVDTVTVNGRTHKILKSPSTNAAGKEWYLDIAFTTAGAGIFAMYTFENYDAATDMGYRGPLGSGNNVTLEGTYFTTQGNTGRGVEDASYWHPNAATSTTSGKTVAIPTVSSSTGYWFSITIDRVIGLLSNQPLTVLYAGLYEPSAMHVANAGSDVFPLCQGKIGQYQSITLNRYPKVVGGGVYLDGLAELQASSMLYYNPLPGIPADLTMISPRSAVRIPITTNYNANNHYGQWGFLRDVAVMRAASNVARGDTVTIAGATWILNTSQGSSPAYSVLFKAV